MQFQKSEKSDLILQFQVLILLLPLFPFSDEIVSYYRFKYFQAGIINSLIRDQDLPNTRIHNKLPRRT